MKKLLAVALAASVLLGLPACGLPAQGETPEGTPSTSPVPVPEADAQAVAGFSLRLFAEAAGQAGTGDLVLSPLSAWMALTLAANGAAGDTRGDLEALLGGGLETLNDLYGALLETLTEPAGRTSLELAGAVWADEALTPAEAFSRALEALGAELFSVDLDSRETLQAVNAWVAEKTRGLIPSLRGETYRPEERLAILNAVYFSAKWLAPFSAEQTREKRFTSASGEELALDFLCANGVIRDYIRTEDVEGVLLPYDDGRTAFLALRATDGRNANELAASLDPEALSAFLEAAQPTCIDFSMPRFAAETSLDLTGLLAALGLEAALDPARADFSALGEGAESFYISSVMQKAKLLVDEEGTEAAAVTALTMATTSLPPEPQAELHLDSPFVYAVVRLEDALPLFLGVLNAPQANA